MQKNHKFLSLFRIMQCMKMSYLNPEVSMIINRSQQNNKINKISYEEQLLSLCALLSENDPMSNCVTLSSNADAVNLLSSSPESFIENEDFVQIGENYVPLIVEDNTNTWYIATCAKKNDDGTYVMDHLHRVDNVSDFK